MDAQPSRLRALVCLGISLFLGVAATVVVLLLPWL